MTETLPAFLVAAAMLGALVLYALSGGADFGGGVWDLLASGRDRAAQRGLVERAIGPIWEANHVWLIIVIVLLFAAFPPAFARVATVLHTPILLLLLSIVMRGVAFTFRHYDTRRDRAQQRWGFFFSGGSVAAPFLMGTIVGALGSGRSRGFEGATLFETAPLWLGAWPATVGAFTLSLFAYLAAVYLCVEARESGPAHASGEPSLVVPFRARALAAWLASALLAVFLFFEARTFAPEIAHGLTAHPWSWPLLGATAAASALALHGLVAGLFRLARAAAAAQVTLIVVGWGASQYPWLVVGEMTIGDAAADPRVLRIFLGALAAGSVLLLPSLYYLFRSFKGERPFSPLDRGGRGGTP